MIYLNAQSGGVDMDWNGTVESVLSEFTVLGIALFDCLTREDISYQCCEEVMQASLTAIRNHIEECRTEKRY